MNIFHRNPNVKKRNTIVVFILLMIVSSLFFLNKVLSQPFKPIPRPKQREGTMQLRVLTANVGNLNLLSCGGPYLINLCSKKIEARLTKNIATLRPDIIALQEIVDIDQCHSFKETNPKKVCFDIENQVEPHQIRRILGPNYTIACDSRNHYECIAVHTDVGDIEGCLPGSLCRDGAIPDLPGPGCDTGFTVSKVTAMLHGVRIGIINAHPQSDDIACRERAVRQIFEGVDDNPPLASEKYNLILGDFNMDPFRKDDSSTHLWKQYVGKQTENKPYYYHNELNKDNLPLMTWSILWKTRTYDYIVSNFAQGIGITLGETPDTARLDNGTGTDHRAILADLQFPSPD